MRGKGLETQAKWIKKNLIKFGQVTIKSWIFSSPNIAGLHVTWWPAAMLVGKNNNLSLHWEFCAKNCFVLTSNMSENQELGKIF